MSLREDSDNKMKYENEYTGSRLATAVRGVGTGEGGDFIVADDPHNVVEWTDNDGKHHTYREGGVPEDVVVPSNATTSSIDSNGNPYEHRRLNTDYDPTIPYVPREDRPEWDAIGLMGKLRIRKGQPTGTRWIKMRNISETVEEWLVR